MIYKVIKPWRWEQAFPPLTLPVGTILRWNDRVQYYLSDDVIEGIVPWEDRDAVELHPEYFELQEGKE